MYISLGEIVTSPKVKVPLPPAPKPVSDYDKIMREEREKILEQQKKMREKRERLELCIKFLRFSMWRTFVEKKKAAKLQKERLSQEKYAKQPPIQYGFNYTLETSGAELTYPPYETTTKKVQETADWLTECFKNLIGNSENNSKECWIKMALCLDLSKFENNILNEWLVKTLSSKEYSLSTMKIQKTCIYKREKILVEQTNNTLSYCIQLLYQIAKDPEEDGYYRSGFKNLHGTRVLLFVMSNGYKKDSERFKAVMENIPEKAHLSVIVFYMQKMMQDSNPELANVENKLEFQKYIENALNLKQYLKDEKIEYYRLKHLKFYFSSKDQLSVPIGQLKKLLVPLIETIERALEKVKVFMNLCYQPFI